MNRFTKRREPFTFMLYLAMIGSGLLFFFLILVFIAKEARNQEIPLKIPSVFWASTWMILTSSATLYWANKAFRKERFRSYRLNISLTLLAGIFFIVLQGFGWNKLLSSGITMQNNTGGMFIYILSGLHIVHTLGGLIALASANKDAFQRMEYVDSFVYSVNPPNQLKIKLISIYWHFIDVLWIAIFAFLLYHASQDTGNSH
jgi:cytochrome c oxidase subunit III